MKVCECGKRFKPSKSGESSRMCNSCRCNRRRNILKIKAVEYKGNKCNRCDYNKCIQALDFHHIDPSTKKFILGKCSSYSWDKIKIELDKCEMLCANCHREHHWNEKTKKHMYKFDYKFTERVDRIKEECKTCGNEFEKLITSKQEYCNKLCANKRTNRTKVKWPSIDILIGEIKNSSFCKVASDLNVCDNAIRKHLKKHNIDPKSIRSIKNNRFLTVDKLK